MAEKQKYAIIVAGGSGTRMGTDIPKQFIEVAGLPILMHTLHVFSTYDASINLILVIPHNQHDYWQSLVKKHQFKVPHQLATGGETRYHSVKNGLALVQCQGLVAVHDAVRPLVSQQTIQNCFDSAEKTGAAVPVVPVTESIRLRTETGSKALNRADYFLVQTPQVFDAELLRKAYEQPYAPTFTDDASVVEASGHAVAMVEGNAENIKITRPLDLVLMQSLWPC